MVVPKTDPLRAGQPVKSQCSLQEKDPEAETASSLRLLPGSRAAETSFPLVFYTRLPLGFLAPGHRLPVERANFASPGETRQFQEHPCHREACCGYLVGGG